MNSSIRVIDDVVSKSYQNHLERMFSGLYWKFHDGITYGGYDLPEESDPHTGFVNVIFSSQDRVRNNETDFFLPLLYEGIDKYSQGELKEIYRIRAVMWVRNQNKEPHLPHRDLAIPHHTMVYYINDTDAPTRLYKDGVVFEEVQPKKGRALIFPGDTQHSSSSPTKSSHRMVLNYNFLI